IGVRPRVLYQGEELEVVGNVIIKECMTAFARYAGTRFVVQGVITHMEFAEPAAARVLGIELHSIARCRVDRESAADLPVCVTVFRPKSEHTSLLLDAHENKKMVTLIVRVVVKPDEGGWKGFLIFEENPVPRPWIFVVEDIVASGDAGS